MPAIISIRVEDEDVASEGRFAQALSDHLRPLDGVESVERRKGTADSMDLGVILEIILTSGATLALAKGLADWLRARRGTRVVIEKNESGKSIKTIVEGIDPRMAERIIELHI